jgi:hypothetical protein
MKQLDLFIASFIKGLHKYLQFFRIVCIAHFSMAIANTPPTNANILYAVIILHNREQKMSVSLNSNTNISFLIF